VNRKKEDLRKVKTHLAIDDAFTTLIKEKNFDNITVKDISEKAMVNRGTFYMHYEDKYDLLEHYEEELLAGLSKNMIDNIEDSHKLTIDMTRQIAKETFEYVNSHHEKIIALFNNPGIKRFEDKIAEYMAGYYREKVAKVLDAEQVKVDIEYLIAYVTGAHISLMKRWLQNNRQESIQEVAQIIEVISINGPFYAAGLLRD
jgi:AcrR family transcriptional regulator